MKQHAIRITAAVLLVSLFVLRMPVHAAGNVSFDLDKAVCDTNRLVDTAMHVRGSSPLCAALFEILFDASVLEFRGAKAADGSTVVTSTANGGSVKLSYLCAEDTAHSGDAVIFTLSFKAVAEGSAAVAFRVSECVGTDAEFLSVGSCTAGTVTVRSPAGATQNRQESRRVKDAAASEASNSRARAGNSSRTASSNSRKEKMSDAPASTEQAHLEGSTINDVLQTDHSRVVPLLLLCLSCILSSVVVGVLIIRSKTRRTDKQDTKTNTEDRSRPG